MCFYFLLQVEATFLRAVHENVKEDHIILEVNSLRYDVTVTSSLFLPIFLSFDPVVDPSIVMYSDSPFWPDDGLNHI